MQRFKVQFILSLEDYEVLSCGEVLQASASEPLDWMKKQLAARISGFSGNDPLFGETEIPLDEWHLHGCPGDTKILVEALVDINRVLAFSSLGWHMYVQMGWFIPQSEEEDEAANTGELTPETVQKSWEHIFSPWTLFPYPIPDKSVELAVDGLRVEEIVRTTTIIIPPAPELPDLEEISENDSEISISDPRISPELRSLLSSAN